MARNTATARRNTSTQRPLHRRATLSRNATGAVAVIVAALVMLVGHGHSAVAALGAVTLYLLVKGRRGPVAGSGTAARRVLRALCWVVVAVAVAAAAQGVSAPGGATFGLALAAALATALRLTAQRPQRRRR